MPARRRDQRGLEEEGFFEVETLVKCHVRPIRIIVLPRECRHLCERTASTGGCPALCFVVKVDANAILRVRIAKLLTRSKRSVHRAAIRCKRMIRTVATPAQRAVRRIVQIRSTHTPVVLCKQTVIRHFDVPCTRRRRHVLEQNQRLPPIRVVRLNVLLSVVGVAGRNSGLRCAKYGFDELVCPLFRGCGHAVHVGIE